MTLTTKKDNCGVWCHTGSHDHKFECCITTNGDVVVGRSICQSNDDNWERFSLRQLHSKHPSNSNFRRTLCFITSKFVLFIVVYSFLIKYPLCYLPICFFIDSLGISAKVGGVLDALAPGQLPRGEMQVRNVKRTLMHSCNDGDELFTMMQKSKAEDSYVRDIKTTPDCF